MALLSGGQSHGYDLKQSIEHTFGSLLPALNTGQIYSTLARLERDGMVEAESVAGDSRGKKLYRLTEAGRAAVEEWVGRVVPGARLKDEFFVKLVVATSAGLAAPEALIDAQRAEYRQSLRDLDARLADGVTGPTAELMVEGAALHLKADLEWLDLIEDRLRDGRIPA